MYLLAVVGVLAVTVTSESVTSLRFPPGFQFGVATSAYQIEGGWNASDKGESIWDRMIHSRPESIYDRSNADVACDSYHLWEEDLRLVQDMGVDFYRFSISWPRLLPHGFSNKVSEDGRRYYSAIIDGLLERGISPMVTLYHWDLPQRLQELGGWTNPLIVDWFADYARVAFSLFADRVHTWITINEPGTICDVSYRGFLAPGVKDHEVGALLCTKHVLLAHATAYRVYQKEFKPKYHGEVSIANQESWFEPKTDMDLEITLLAREYLFGRYSHPIFSATGGWPPALQRYMADKSKREGFSRSRLPAFTQDEIRLVKGSFDYYGLNHYTSRVVRAAVPGEPLQYMMQGIEEVEAALETRPHWGAAAASWLKVNPQGLRRLLQLIKQQYGDVKILITENGYSDTGAQLQDRDRVQYYRDYLEQVLLAMNEDAVRVVGYTAWSLLDNFEWVAGYTSRFGLYAVDFSSPLRPRAARASARFYAGVARAGARSVAPAHNTTRAIQ
ncbi:myrosinase 1-like [Leguminivora glycinivorella]|uniref:myrosinase 1-like n=1 Tax=Leguminivora glycinivorella TaxID=1035111 RepID=UPI00200EF80B|nr:myrosinase 1-like [Leguminivora glycinivorella]